MKPLRLKMSAFGSYADVQSIDFTRLGTSGLYLITGETGSGKTTIFDAISYALFGEASGKARNRYPMLRSDFAGENAKTFVELDFSSADKAYFVRRTIRNSGQDVELCLPDGTSLHGERSVRPKIAEIVGLDRNQFAQIVMIAQNDFLRFLQSGTDERVEILRRIFGTGALKDFQDRLKARARELGSELKLCAGDFERHGLDLATCEERFAQWEAQLTADRKRLAEADEKLAEYEKRRTDLAARTAVAQELAKKFGDLGAARAAQAGHSARADEMRQLAGRLARGEIALRRIKPFADGAAETARRYTAAQAELAQARTAADGARAERTAARQVLAGLPPLEAQRAAFDTSKEAWERSAERLGRLSALKSNHDLIEARRSELPGAQSALEVLIAEFKAADDRYRTIEEAFLRGQAGILAKNLVPEKPCPVCGSVEHPAPARLADEGLSESQLKKAKDVLDKVRAKRDAKATACAELRTAVGTLTERFLADFSGFSESTSGAVWEEAGVRLTEMLKEAQSEMAESAARKKAEEASLAALARAHEAALKRGADADKADQAARTLAEERERRERELRVFHDEARTAYLDALRTQGFADEADYVAARVTEEELAAMSGRLAGYEKEGERLDLEIGRLTAETAGREKPDVDRLAAEAKAVDTASAELRGQRDETRSRIEQTERRLGELRQSALRLAALEKRYAAVRQLSDAANGRLDFETYAQMAYFERVLRAANLRLERMSQGRYAFLRKTGSDDGKRKWGLELEVLDAYTGKARSANSLSGGESFLASLSLALGLSDVVQQSAGGVRLDAMFIDEGFGFLDPDALELAIRTLAEMTDGGRLIGIISHVAELGERIDRQIRVEKTPTGSRLHQGEPLAKHASS